MRALGVPRSRLRPGTVVLAWVPYDDQGGCPDASERGKLRPVVVVRVSGCECVCRPCTSAASRLRHPWAHTEIDALDAAGLSRPTAVRRREMSLSVGDCLDVCGVLAESDFDRVLGPACADAWLAS